MIKFKNAKVISHRDWNKFVKKAYGRPYNLQQQGGCYDKGVLDITVPNDEAEDFENTSIPEKVNGDIMGVNFGSWLSRDPKQKISNSNASHYHLDDHSLNLWWERNFYPCLEVLANDLRSKGLIEDGSYLIIIDW